MPTEKAVPKPTAAAAAKADLATRHAARQARKSITEAEAPSLRAEPSADQPIDPLRVSASYFILRRGLAYLAIALPVLLVAGGAVDYLLHDGDGHLVHGSLSAYYHSTAAMKSPYGAGTMRNVFVGVLWAVGVFLVLYRGYSRREDLALNLAGVAAILIALFPMDWPVVEDAAHTPAAYVHFTSAGTFFLAIAYVCVFTATETLSILNDRAQRTSFKRQYAALGAWMVLTPVVLWVIHMLFPPKDNYVILFVEIAGVLVFSMFWLVKSREIMMIERE